MELLHIKETITTTEDMAITMDIMVDTDLRVPMEPGVVDTTMVATGTIMEHVETTMADMSMDMDWTMVMMHGGVSASLQCLHPHLTTARIPMPSPMDPRIPMENQGKL